MDAVRGGVDVIGVRSRVPSMPSSAIGNQRSLRQVLGICLNPLWRLFFKYCLGQLAEV